MSEELKNQNGSPDEGDEQTVDSTGETDMEEMEPVSPEQEIEQLQQELAESKDQFLRLAAEFENFKRRMERERESLVKYAGENILRELLASVDNLDRALEQGSAETDDVQQKFDAMLEGVSLTQKGLLATLEKFDVVPIESEGLEFNPNEHEAMTMEASDTVPANHVLQEFMKGYQFKDSCFVQPR